MPPYQKWVSKFEIKPGSWVFVPSSQSISSGNRIKADIERIWQPPKNYFHLRNGGHVTAIKMHCRSRSFIHLDIKDFFGSINRSRVTRCLKQYYSYAVARIIANQSTVLLPESSPAKFILPFGFVQSPIIASLCLHKSYLGETITKLSNTVGINLSVYMDDIIISLNDQQKADMVLERVQDAAERSSFLLNPAKTEGPAEQITSFNINLSHDNIEIEQERFDKFKNDYNSATANSHQKQGYKNYIKSVNPNQSTLLI
ncbi:reverse transcriptase [Candidatus Roizmanbacteria bacterium]|nr:reverse transcriptase [Candidatus Roizmanbacteria bacterium]